MSPCRPPRAEVERVRSALDAARCAVVGVSHLGVKPLAQLGQAMGLGFPLASDASLETAKRCSLRFSSRAMGDLAVTRSGVKGAAARLETAKR